MPPRSFCQPSEMLSLFVACPLLSVRISGEIILYEHTSILLESYNVNIYKSKAAIDFNIHFIKVVLFIMFIYTNEHWLMASQGSIIEPHILEANFKPSAGINKNISSLIFAVINNEVEALKTSGRKGAASTCLWLWQSLPPCHWHSSSLDLSSNGCARSGDTPRLCSTT